MLDHNIVALPATNPDATVADNTPPNKVPLLKVKAVVVLLTELAWVKEKYVALFTVIPVGAALGWTIKG